MRPTETAGTWVVYRKPVRGRDGGLVALCSQREWDDMDRAQPGHFTLIRAGITNEGEAERLARSTPPTTPDGAAPPRVRPRPPAGRRMPAQPAVERELSSSAPTEGRS
jgi:hypothetical protein